MKIAVLGATGLIGQHTARAIISEGNALTVIHREGSRLDRLGDLTFESAIADLDDQGALVEALSGVDAVVNCAGYYPTEPRPWKEEVQRATVQMGNFYSACAQHALRKVVYVGGAVALRKHPAGLPGNESLDYASPPPDKNAYLQVKWWMDRLAIEQAEKGLPVTIGIPATTFGEYDYGPTTGRILVEVANQTLPAYIEGPRNVIYAGDVGRGLARVCAHGEPGERYLLVGTNTMMSDIIERVAAKAGVPAPRAVSLRAAKLVGKLQSWRYALFKGEPPRISETVIGVVSAGQHLDGTKAEQSLGFKATTSIDETIERSLRWLQDKGYIH